MIKWYKYVQVIIHLTQKITITIPSSPLLADTVSSIAVWCSSSYLEIIILQKADGAHEQTGEDRLWLQLHQKACIIFHSMLVLYNIAASISKNCNCLRATESAWVDKRMCSDSQNGGASLIKVWSSLRWGVEFNATTLKTRFYQPWPHQIFFNDSGGYRNYCEGWNSFK